MVVNARLVPHYQTLSRSGVAHEQRRDAKDADWWRPGIVAVIILTSEYILLFAVRDEKS